MNTRRQLLTVAAMAATIAAVGAVGPARAHAPVGTIPFELVGLVAQPAAINVQEGHPIRVADPDDRSQVPDLLAYGNDGAFAAEIVSLIDHRYPDAVPEGTTLLVGVVHTGCFEAQSVLVTAEPSGAVTMTGEPSEEEGTVLCTVALSSVAVVAVDSAAAPPGSTDGAELVAFGPAGTVELAPQGKEDRRFVFVLDGCAETTAELVVTPWLIDATLEVEPGAPIYDCEMAEQFLAVFDVPAIAVRPTATLGTAG